MKRLKILIIIWLFLFPFYLVKASDKPNYYVIKSDQAVTIKRLPNDEQALNEIVTYAVLAQTLIILSAQAFSSMAFISKLNFLQYLKVFVPFLIARKAPRNDFSGLVYDAVTSRPIPFAVIRVKNSVDGKVVQTEVSDIEGRYGILLHPGLYIVDVQHQDYDFPVSDKGISAVQNDNCSYFGDKIKIVNEAALNLNMPMKPRLNNKKLSINKIRSMIVNSFIFKLTRNLYFIYAIFLLSLIMLINEFSWLMLSLTVYYGIFSILHLIAYFKKLPRTWGRVIDTKTKNPIKNMFLKFYSSDGKLLESKISDETGRFQIFLNDGDYYAIVQSNEYKIIKAKSSEDSQRIKFNVNRRSINLIIELERLSNKTYSKLFQ